MKAFTTFALVVLAVVGLTLAGCSPAAPGDKAPAADSGKAVDAKPAVTPPAAAVAPAAAPAATPESAPAAATNTGMAAETPAAAPAAPAAPEAAAAPAAPAGAPLTAENIVGSKWSASGMVFTFEKDGALKVGAAGSELPGTWKLEGTALTVSAMGQDFKAEIQGDKIVYDGAPLQRVP